MKMTGRLTPSESLNKEGIIKIEVPIKCIYINRKFPWPRFLRPEFLGPSKHEVEVLGL
jgi:hypothetical protein